MTIEFACEHCGKPLSTDDDKAGRKAKCPGCGEPVTVPAPQGAPADDEAPLVPPPLSRSGRTVVCPMCGAKSSASAPVCESCGEPLAQVAPPERRKQASEPVVFDVGSVLSRSWNIFKRDLGLVVGGQIVAGMLSMAALLPAIGLMIGGIVTAEQAGDEVAPVVIALFGGAGLLGLVGGAVALWLQLGVTLLLLGLTRGSDVSFGTLFTGGRYLLRFFLCTLIYNVMVQIGSQLCVLPGLLVGVFFWPFPYILVDDDVPHIQALLDAPKLAARSWLMTIVLAIVAFGLIVLGALAAGVGLIFTMPFMSLTWCVAYDEMLGGGSVGATDDFPDDDV